LAVASSSFASATSSARISRTGGSGSIQTFVPKLARLTATIWLGVSRRIVGRGTLSSYARDRVLSSTQLLTLTRQLLGADVLVLVGIWRTVVIGVQG